MSDISLDDGEIDIPMSRLEMDRVRLEQELERELELVSFISADDLNSRLSDNPDGFENRLHSSKFDIFDRSPDYQKMSNQFRDFSMDRFKSSHLSSVERGMAYSPDMRSGEISTHMPDGNFRSRISISDHLMSPTTSSESSAPARQSQMHRNKLTNTLDRSTKQNTPRYSNSKYTRFMKSPSQMVASRSTPYVPKSFKNNESFLNEMSHKEPVRGNSKTYSQSFKLPEVPDVSSLLTGQEFANAMSSNYKEIASIPLSSQNQAVMLGLRALQDKVDFLEFQNTTLKHRSRDLEKELDRARNMYEMERQRTVAADEKARKAKEDSGVGSDSSDRAEDRERVRLSHVMERLRSEDKVKSLKSKIDVLERQIKANSVLARNLEEEREEAVRALAQALNEIEELKSANAKLQKELQKSKERTNNSNAHSSEKPTHDTRKASSQHKSQRSSARRKVEDVSFSDEGIERSEPNSSFVDDDERERLRAEIENERHARISNENKKSKIKKSPFGRKIGEKKLERNPVKSKNRPHSVNIYTQKATPERYVINAEEAVSDEDSGLSESAVYSDEVDSEFETVEPVNQGRRQKMKSFHAHRNIQLPPKVYKTARRISHGITLYRGAACPVCSLKRAKREHLTSRSKPTYVEKSSHDPVYEDGPTIRPSQPAHTALHSVLHQLEDEFGSLKHEYQNIMAEYEAMDPGYEKRKRKAVVENLRSIIEQLENKADQIYSLYDVVEAESQSPKEAGQTPSAEPQSSRREWIDV